MRQAQGPLAGGGEMGALVRELDWSKTPLGPVSQWPQSLRTAVGICLASRFPMLVWWGPRLVQLYNDGYRPVLGAKHPRSLGQSGDECWREVWGVLGPLYEQVRATGEPTWSEDLPLFMERYGYVEETYFTFSYSAIRDETGGVGGVLVTCVETTERVLGERRLATLSDLAARAGEAKTAEAACSTAAAVLARNPADLPFSLVYLLDADGTRARLTGGAGLSPGAAASPGAIDLTGPDAERGWPIAAVARTGRAETVTDLAAHVGQLPGGPWPDPPTSALVLPIAAAGQERPAGVLVAGVSARRTLDAAYRRFFELVAGHVATAITDARAYEAEKRRAEALAELDRAKTAFFSNVSHEFRTPLTLMLGPMEDALGSSGAGLAGEALEVAHRNALRLLRLVNTLLDFARIEAGRIEAVYEPTDLAAYTAELASTFRSAVERAGLRLVVDCPSLPEPVFVDREMWEKVVLNLLSNAFKFTFEGTITVALRAAGANVELAVLDTGVGIPGEELPRLFERFHRVRSARARTHEGSGIGLALVQELVKLHGGSIRAASEAGAGTAFTVTLPFGRDHLPAERVRATPILVSPALGAASYVEEALRWLPEGADPAPAPGGEALSLAGAEAPVGRAWEGATAGARILLVDDNADMREYVRRLLAPRWTVETAGDGAAALAAARARVPDLVLSDVMMPGLDGFELLRELRADPRTAAVPVIVLSARAGEESRVEGLEAGADDYLVKPFSARELLARVGAHLQMARVRAEATRLTRDMNARLTAVNAELRESEARFRHMADSAPVMVRVTDTEARCTFLSRSWYEFTGQVPESGLGFGWMNAVHPDDRARARDVFLAANGSREPFRVDYRLRRRDGEHRWAIDSAVPRLGPNGEFLGYIGSVIDITDRKRAEEDREQLLAAERAARAEAEAAVRARDAFLARASHELRTPLTSALGTVRLLERAMDGRLKERPRDLIDIAGRSLDAMLALVNDLLDASKVMAEGEPLLTRPVDVAAAVEQSLAVVAPQSREKGLRVHAAVVPAGLRAQADPLKLEQVLVNLLANAVKFTPAGGEIELAARQDGDQVVVRVCDSGEGILPEHLERIFEPFFQARPEGVGRPRGTGLGLAICRQIVALHGGRIWAESEGPGQGSTLVVCLPVATTATGRAA